MPFEDPNSGSAPEPGTPSAPTAPEQPWQQFAVYDGEAGSIGKIAVINAVLGLFTLGIYRFWGKTRIRQYIWGRISLLGDRLEYTGTPKELLLGFLVAAGFMILIGIGFAALSFLVGAGFMVVALQAVYVIGIYFLLFFAIYRARRYRLTRTQWRGIRFGQTGSARKYALLALALMFLTGITLGLAYPYMQNRLQQFRTGNTWFGNRQLEFDGRASDLFWKWFLALVVAIPTLYISILWYKVTEFRYYAAHTRFGTLSFSSTLSTGRVFVIWLIYGVCFFVLYSVFAGLIVAAIGALGGLEGIVQDGQAPEFSDIPTLLIAVTVFLALTFVAVLSALYHVLFLHPMIKAVSENLQVRGTIDLDEIKQSDQERGGRGEGFADVLDVGAI